MPTYIYEHPETKELIEVFQDMNAEHVYIDEKGIKWNRIFSPPTYSLKGSPLDFRSEKDKEKWEKVYKKRYQHKNSKNK